MIPLASIRNRWMRGLVSRRFSDLSAAIIQRRIDDAALVVNAGAEAFAVFTTDVRLPQSIVGAQTSRYGVTASYKMFDDNSVSVIFSHRFLAAVMMSSAIVQHMFEERFSAQPEILANCARIIVLADAITPERFPGLLSVAAGGIERTLGPAALRFCVAHEIAHLYEDSKLMAGEDPPEDDTWGLHREVLFDALALHLIDRGVWRLRRGEGVPYDFRGAVSRTVEDGLGGTVALFALDLLNFEPGFIDTHPAVRERTSRLLADPFGFPPGVAGRLLSEWSRVIVGARDRSGPPIPWSQMNSHQLPKSFRKFFLAYSKRDLEEADALFCATWDSVEAFVSLCAPDEEATRILAQCASVARSDSPSLGRLWEQLHAEEPLPQLGGHRHFDQLELQECQTFSAIRSERIRGILAKLLCSIHYNEGR